MGQKRLDPLVTQNGALLFGSFWGRDTAILESLSRFQIPASQGGISFITVGQSAIPATVNADKLSKSTGRVVHPVYGNLIHLWLYNPSLCEPDRVNSSMLTLLRTPDNTIDEILIHESVWKMLQEISPYPVLPHWEVTITRFLFQPDNDFVVIHYGLQCSCIALSLDLEYFRCFLSEAIRSGDLSLEVN